MYRGHPTESRKSLQNICFDAPAHLRNLLSVSPNPSMVRRLSLLLFAVTPLAQGASAPDPRLTLAMLPVADMQAVAPTQYGAASGLAAGGAGPLGIALAAAAPLEGATQHVIVLGEVGESPVSTRLALLPWCVD